MSDYTPTTDEREALILSIGHGMNATRPTMTLRAQCEVIVDALLPRLAAHDREVAAKALRDAASALYADETAERGTTKALNHATYAAWLLERADRIEATP
jgi:hypothetical protein